MSHPHESTAGQPAESAIGCSLRYCQEPHYLWMGEVLAAVSRLWGPPPPPMLTEVEHGWWLSMGGGGVLWCCGFLLFDGDVSVPCDPPHSERATELGPSHSHPISVGRTEDVRVRDLPSINLKNPHTPVFDPNFPRFPKAGKTQEHPLHLPDTLCQATPPQNLLVEGSGKRVQ